MEGKCENCNNWVRADRGLFLTEHHPNCSKYDPEKEAYEIMIKLLSGIESWASEEDGVYPELWENYKKAKIFCGQFDVLKKDYEK